MAIVRQTAHTRAMRASVPEIATRLQEWLGKRLTAIVAGRQHGICASGRRCRRPAPIRRARATGAARARGSRRRVDTVELLRPVGQTTPPGRAPGAPVGVKAVTWHLSTGSVVVSRFVPARGESH